MTKRPRITRYMKQNNMTFNEAYAKYQDNIKYFPNVRNFNINYSLNDLYSSYTDFKNSLRQRFQLNNNKKLKRFIKHYQWYSPVYIDNLILKLMKDKFNKQLIHKFINITEDTDYLVFHTHEFYKIIYHIFNNFDKEDINVIKAWAKWTLLMLYYYGMAVDEFQQIAIHTLLAFIHLLEINDIKNASLLYANCSSEWSD